MEATAAIRLRRSVRQYTDQPVADADIDAILRLALLAPTGSMSQAWSFIVVRDPEIRRPLAEMVIRGGTEYFRRVRKPAPAESTAEHAERARGYAAQWVTDWCAYDPAAASVLGAKEGERFVGFVHVGTAKEKPTDRPRPAVDEVLTEWKAPA